MLRRMFFGFSFLIICIASVYSVFVFCPKIASPVTASGISESAEPLKEKQPQTEESKTASTTSKAEKSSSTAATGGAKNAKGKIITKTVGKGAANLIYNNVYINNLTGLYVDIKKELSIAPSVKLENTKKPQVLIVHTHTTECYMQNEKDFYTEADKSRSTKDTENLIAVGKVLKTGLEANGIGVVHATEKHDYPEYTGSYDRAAVTIKNYLKKYPTIKVVIDLHRDAMTDSAGNKTALTTEIKGQKAAQVMLVSGCENGGVTGFPNWRENFRLALRLQQTMETKYQGLARPIHFTSRKYNQNITNGSLLIECGTDANTLQQAKYSAVLLADCLAETLKSLK